MPPTDDDLRLSNLLTQGFHEPARRRAAFMVRDLLADLEPDQDPAVFDLVTYPEGSPPSGHWTGREADPVHRGRDAIYRPWAFLEWPELDGRQAAETNDPGR